MGSCRVHDFPLDEVPHHEWIRVYGPHGHVVYCVDNYRNKCCGQVFLMDRHGKLLFTIIRRTQVFGRLDGYKCESGASSVGEICFQVRRGCSVLGRGRLTAEVFLQLGNTRKSYNAIEGLIEKSEFRVIDRDGTVVAEAKGKELTSGVCLGEDVLALSMEGENDPSLMAALVALYGSICCRMRSLMLMNTPKDTDNPYMDETCVRIR